MQVKRFLCAFLSCALAINLCFFSANAIESDTGSYSPAISRASGRFSLTVKANSFSKSSSSLPLAAGEIVSISATYTPRAQSIDVGLMDEYGTFYYVTATGGSVNANIQVETRGNYKLTIRNTTNVAIDVTGIINY